MAFKVSIKISQVTFRNNLSISSLLGQKAIFMFQTGKFRSRAWYWEGQVVKNAICILKEKTGNFMFCYVKDQQTDGTLERVIQHRYV